MINDYFELQDYEQLLPHEWVEYSDLVDNFVSAKAAKNFGLSDSIRYELLQWNAGLSEEKITSMFYQGIYEWHPIFETTNHRQKRIDNRNRILKMATFKKGDKVAQIVPVIKGEIAKFAVDQETGDVQYLVEWQDADGNPQSRYFKESEIELDADATPVVGNAPEEQAASLG